MKRFVGFLMLAISMLPVVAEAHNETVHRNMTDYAYEILLSMAIQADPRGQLPAEAGMLQAAFESLARADPRFPAFFRAAFEARAKFRGIPSGLTEEDVPCVSPVLTILFGGDRPVWGVPPGALQDQPLSGVRLPVTATYNHGNASCGIDENWSPPGIFALVNRGVFTARDHTGVTLGYWAAAPDFELRDWVLRSTVWEDLRGPLAGTTGAGTTALVGVLCAFGCSVFPVLCPACPILSFEAGRSVSDEILSFDPLEGPTQDGDFVGLGHFIDMKPTPRGVLNIDEKPGKRMARAGPLGRPDETELLVTAFLDLMGVHLDHDQSQGPANYQIVLGSRGPAGLTGDDFHRNSIFRTAPAWEDPTVADLQLTPVDNLAMFGWLRYQALGADTTATVHPDLRVESAAQRLGWPLHAIGDATVPMHINGASGFGHRPYEDSVEFKWNELVAARNSPASVGITLEVMRRAMGWRQFILDWRARNAGELRTPNEVPVRDLVTALAESTRRRAAGAPGVFNRDASLVYMVDKGIATSSYESSAMTILQRDRAIEGIAATLAFLISASEVI